MVLGLALLGFTGCSNGDSDNDAESNSLNSKADEILDLRIKKLQIVQLVIPGQWNMALIAK